MDLSAKQAKVCKQVDCYVEAEPGSAYCEDHGMAVARVNSIPATLGGLADRIRAARVAGVIKPTVAGYGA